MDEPGQSFLIKDYPEGREGEDFGLALRLVAGETLVGDDNEAIGRLQDHIGGAADHLLAENRGLWGC